MSETVYYKGKLTEVQKLKNETLEEQCKRLLGDNKLDTFYRNYQEQLNDELYEQYIIHNKVIYSIIREELDADNDMYIINPNKDGGYDFEVKYYNGGCGFTEAIEEAFKNFNDK